MKSPDLLKVTKVPLTDRGIDKFIGYLGFLICIEHSDFLKEISKLSHHFLQLLTIVLHLLNGFRVWLSQIGGCKDIELVPKLAVDILQSKMDLVGFYPKDWNMSAILIFKDTLLIITNRGGGLVA
jgi:hypothetical protein